MAAMLAWQVGDDKVVTVEVDKDLAETARGNLDRVEKQPEVVTGDAGHASRAPMAGSTSPAASARSCTVPTTAANTHTDRPLATRVA
ncbi:hypothetical protein GNZ18_23545 [Actinomadura sp. NEAU-AAG5]|uniref:Uncharacterized protein n=2 Tax=Actinomadura litoris TaxID=2678616 RepID=A0A7K1L582_9ACTN|nr:hypothetical protein [Actinomadura litoris]